MFVLTRRLATIAVFAAAFMLPHRAAAQVSMFQACSQGSLANCAVVRLTTQLGIGPGGLNLFEIALQNLGSHTTPSLATSVYFLSFLTGQAAATPGTEVDALATPKTEGGATVSDASDWSVFESGDAIFLSALGANGIGGCAASSPVGGIGQMGQTCGDEAFITFSFFTSRVFDPSAMTLASLETVGIATGNPFDSCNESTPCVITPLAPPVTATPEPGTMLLALTGLAGIGGMRLRRRSSAGRTATTSGA